MTETRFTWRWLLVIALVGIFMGLAVGLLAGWIIFPNIGGSNVAGLSASGQNDYIVLVANTYAYDQDLKRAQERLVQLQDNDIKTRVARLAQSFAVRKDPSAANLADLAIALGSDDSSLQVLAQQVTNSNDNSTNSQEPTKIAQADTNSEPTATTTAQEPTAKPTKVKKANATPTNEATPTDTPKPKAPAAKATAKPTDVPATAAPAVAPITTQMIPDYPSGWWQDIHLQGASISPGQQYWHLKYALFCDVDDQRNNCPGLPGGGMDHSIYVQVLNPDGSCADATIKHDTNTGDTTALYQKDVTYPWNDSSCRTDFEWNMYGEGNDIWVDGAPSDKITGLCLCNVVPPPGTTGILQGHAHVRYFLIFQKTTR